MLYASSTVSRRIVGRIEIDENLLDALVRVCRDASVLAGQIRCQGTLSSVELGVFDREHGDYITSFKSGGSLELLSLDGNVSMMGAERVINAHATVAFASHGQNRVVGGQLRNATVHAVEFVIDVFDDLELNRFLDSETRLPLWKEVLKIEKKPGPTPTAPNKAVSDEDVAPEPEPERKGASRPVDPELEDDLEHLVTLEPGDILRHPKLGECEVVRVEDEDSVFIRLPRSGRVSKLSLAVVRLERVEDAREARVFKLIAVT
jgi:predicted DNA-binding protein with PD1-like motif